MLNDSRHESCYSYPRTSCHVQNQDLSSMTYVRCSCLFILCVMFILQPALWADGFRNPPDTAADPSAVFNNPANLVDLPAPQVQLSVLAGYSHADYDGRLGKTDTERPWSALPSFAPGIPLADHRFAVGLGAHLPFGRQTRWDSKGVFRYTAPVSTEMMVADLSPTLAWRRTGKPACVRCRSSGARGRRRP